MTQLMRYDPVFDILRPTDIVSDLFRDDLFAPIEQMLAATDITPLAGEEISSFGNLPLDVYETDDALVVEAALPGFKPEEIEIEEQQGVLTIRAEHKEEKEEKGDNWLLNERSVQVFERSFPLPVDVKADKAEAKLENGVLHIALPKSEAGKKLTNRIKVSAPKLKLPKIGKKEGKVKVKKD